MAQLSFANFTLAEYRQLLAYFKRSHEYVTFSEVDPRSTSSPKLILLRHDIDYSLKQALEFARLEADQGVRATYFLLFSAPTYNLLDSANIGLPRQIAALGHEVGLHYDVAAMLQGNKSHPLDVLHAQARLLGELSGSPVRSIAMHNPSISGADLFRSAPYVNAYDDRFTRAMSYYSDSCMAWRDSFVEALAADAFPERVHLLIHPELWTAQRAPRFEKLERVYADAQHELAAGLLATREMWRRHGGVREHDRREAPVELLKKAAS